MKVKRTCQYCNIEFEVEQAEVKRGWGRYCSISCSAKNQKPQTKIFTPESILSMKTITRKVNHIPCEICSWEESIRDVHHIIPVKDGGQNKMNNLIVLCPNHHRCAHTGILSQEYLLQVVSNRNWSNTFNN